MASGMKSVLILAAVCAFAAVSCISRTKTADNNSEHEACVVDTVARPSLTFEHEAWNFGTIAETDGPVKHTFHFTNTGPKPVVVERVDVTCGCMKPLFSQTPILPDGKGEIEITYNPADRPGSFDKAAYIYADANRRMLIRIRGEVTPRPRTDADLFPVDLGEGIRLANSEVNFRLVEQGHDRQLTLRCLNTSQREVTLDARFGSPCAYLTIGKPIRLSPGVEGELAVVCDLTHEQVWGTFYADLIVTVDGKALSKTVTVRGAGIADLDELRQMAPEKRPQAVVEESLLDFGSHRASATAECSFVLENKGQSPLRICAVNCPLGVTALFAPGVEVPAGGSQKLSLRVDGRKAGAGNYFSHVELLVNDALQPLCDLRLRGRFE